MGLVEDGVGEKRTRAAGVRVGAVEHHPLAPAQVQHGLGRQLQGGVLAQVPAQVAGEFGIAQRPAAVGARQAHHHLGHHVAGPALETAVAVDKTALGRGQLAAAVTGTVPDLDGHDRLGHLLAVSPDVLHRRPAGQARYTAQALDAGQTFGHAEADECRPVLARSGPDQRPGTVGLNGYTFYRHSHHRPREALVGDDEVAAAPEHEHRATGAIGLLEDGRQRRHLVHFAHDLGRPPQAKGRPPRQGHAPQPEVGRPAARPGHRRSRVA